MSDWGTAVRAIATALREAYKQALLIGVATAENWFKARRKSAGVRAVRQAFERGAERASGNAALEQFYPLCLFETER